VSALTLIVLLLAPTALEPLAEAWHGLPPGLLARARAYEGDRDVVRRRIGCKKRPGSASILRPGLAVGLPAPGSGPAMPRLPRMCLNGSPKQRCVKVEYLVCGRYQINAGESWRLCRLARGAAGPWIAAQLLAESRAWCRRRPGVCPCSWARWNFLDRTRLCRSLGDEHE